MKNLELFTDVNKLNKESVYTLGLMWADGYIYPKANRVSITCIKSDMDDIKDVIMSTYDWKIYIRNAKGVRKEQLTFMTHNKEFCQWLVSYDYASKKSKSADKILDFIPQKYHKYWWRGYLDGDGCIYTTKFFQVFFTSSYNQDWNFVNKFPIKLQWKELKRKTNKGSYSRRMLTTKKNCLLLLDFIYNGYEGDKIGFTRKNKKYLEIKNIKPTKFKGSGVYLNKIVNKWCARISYKRKGIALGYFENKSDAENAVLKKRQEILKNELLLNVR
jgi:hypothetical protein